MVAAGVAGSLADLVYGYFYACTRTEGDAYSRSNDPK
jgi:hypothetical protein